MRLVLIDLGVGKRKSKSYRWGFINHKSDLYLRTEQATPLLVGDWIPLEN